MYTAIYKSSLILFFVTSYLNGMESDFSIKKVPPTHDCYRPLWIVTRDNKLFCCSKELLRHCFRLQLGCRLYPDNSQENPIKKVCFTKKNIRLLQKALSNPQCVTERTVNSVMTMAESFGAYVLYAYYVNQLSENLDKNLIVPVLKTVSNKIGSDILLSTLFSAQDIVTGETDEHEKILRDCCGKNQDYYVQKVAKSNDEDWEGTYSVYNWRHEEQYAFKSSNDIPLHGSPYIFRKGNFVLYYKAGGEDSEVEIIAKLYDLNNKKKLWSSSCGRVIISKDENYMAVYCEKKPMIVYNIATLTNIKQQTISCGHKYFYWDFIFSPDSTKLITEVLLLDDQGRQQKKELMLWNMSDFVWDEEEHYIPYKELGVIENDKSIADMDCDSTGRYCCVQYSRTDYGAPFEIIDLVTGSSRSFSDGFIIPQINLIVYQPNELRAELYSLGEHFRFLYRYRNSFALTCEETKNRSYIAVYNSFYVGSQDSHVTLLKYDQDNNFVTQVTESIKGSLCDINKRGWVIAEKNFGDNCFFYDNNGKEIAQYSQRGRGLAIKYPKFLSSQNGIDTLRGTSISLYSQEAERQCDALWNNVNCAQYALLNAIYSDVYQRNECGTITFKKDSLEDAILDTFQVNDEEKKSYLCDKLKLAIKS